MAIKASNQVSLLDITDAYSVTLTSETYTFMGDTSGAPSGLTCTTQVVAYCGANQCLEVNVLDVTCPTGISATISNNGTSSPTITFRTTSVITDSCEATISVEVDGVTVNKKFSFAVAKQGDIPEDVVTKGELVEELNSELKIDGNCISLTTGNFTINSKNITLDASGNATFSGTITGASGEFTKGFNVDIPHEGNIDYGASPYYGSGNYGISMSNLGIEMFFNAGKIVSDNSELYVRHKISTKNGSLMLYANSNDWGEGVYGQIALNANKGINFISTDGSFNFHNGKVNLLSGYLNMNGKNAIQGTDDWLRLNQDNEFVGTYSPGLIRSDSGFVRYGGESYHYAVFSYGANANLIDIILIWNGYLHINTKDGSAYGATIWTSDTRLKKNIKDSMVSGLEFVNAIEHISFDWKDETCGAYGTKPVKIGYSANQLQELDPDVVMSVKQGENSEYDTILQIDHTKVIPYLSKAIQEQSEIISEQDKALSKLEERIIALEEKLNSIA